MALPRVASVLAGSCLLLGLAVFYVNVLRESGPGDGGGDSRRLSAGLVVPLSLELRGRPGAQRALEIHTALGRAYGDLGQYTEALGNYREACELAATVGLGEELAEAHGGLGVMHLRLGQLRDAHQELDKAAALADPLGRLLPWLLQMRGNAHRELGQVKEALALYAWALRLSQSLSQPPASLLNDIGRAHLVRGELDEAMAHFQRAANPGGAHQAAAPGGAGEPQLAARAEAALSLSNIGEVIHIKGDSQAALVQYEDALRHQEQLLRAGHPAALRTRLHIARAQRDLGRQAEAHRTITRAESLAGGRREPQTALVLSLKGDLLREQGYLPEAVSALREALDIQLECFGHENHPDASTTLNALGSTLHDQHHFSEAMVYYKRSLKAAQASVGDESPDAYAAHNNLATLYQDLGRLKEAQEEFTRSLEIQLKTVGASSADVGASYNNLATVHYRGGHYEEAERLLAKAIAVADGARVPGRSPDRLTYAENHKKVLEMLRSRPQAAAASSGPRAPVAGAPPQVAKWQGSLAAAPAAPAAAPGTGGTVM